MLSNNALSDKFSLLFTEDFFINSICDRYDLLLKQKNYPLISIRDMIKESIQSVEIPSFAYEPISQTIQDNNNAGTDYQSTGKESEQRLADQKRVSINFRHTTGYLTYFCLLEHYFMHYSMGTNNQTKRKPFTSIVLTTYSRLNQPFARMYYRQCLFLAIPSLFLSYANTQRSYTEFTCVFSYNELQPSIDVPETILKK